MSGTKPARGGDGRDDESDNDSKRSGRERDEVRKIRDSKAGRQRGVEAKAQER